MTNLLEGRGIAARETIKDDGSGAIFANDEGKTIELYDMVYFPPEGGKYEDDKKGEVDDPVKGRDKCIAAVAEWMESQDINPQNFKMVNAPAKAAAVSLWRDSDGDMVAFGRYATNIRPGALGISWTNTQFAKETGYSSTDAITKSENVALKPSDLFTSEAMTIPQLLTTVNNLPDSVPEELREIVPALLNAVARGEETYVPEADKHRSVIEKYVGEYAAAIALSTGNFVSGNVDEVAEQVLGPQGGSWDSMTKVQFPTSVTQVLVDSYLLSDDQSVRLAISSKANRGSGAAASVGSVSAIIRDRRDLFDPKVLKKHEELIQGINLIADNSAKEGVYKCGKLYGFVSDNDIKVIEYLIKSFDKDEKMLTTNLKKIARTYPNKANLEKTLNHPNYNVGYRLLAGLARKVADHLNSKNPTELFQAALAKSYMCQVYAKTQKKGDALAFVDFQVVFPPSFDGTIYFDALTNFYSTDAPKGRMTFKLKR